MQTLRKSLKEAFIFPHTHTHTHTPIDFARYVRFRIKSKHSCVVVRSACVCRALNMAHERSSFRGTMAEHFRNAVRALLPRWKPDIFRGGGVRGEMVNGIDYVWVVVLCSLEFWLFFIGIYYKVLFLKGFMWMSKLAPQNIYTSMYMYMFSKWYRLRNKQ